MAGSAYVSLSIILNPISPSAFTRVFRKPADQRRFPDFDTKLISVCAREMTVREIRGHLEEL